MNLFNKLRRTFGESYAVDIPNEIVGYLDKFRKDGNYSSHEIETFINSNYVNEIKDNFTATLRVLFQLYQKIINSDKKIEKIEEKLLNSHGKILKNADTSKIVRLISSIRNDIANINHHEPKDQISITLNEKERIQEKIDELHVSITKINLNTDSLIGIIKNISYLEFELHSKYLNTQSLKNYLELISMYFKANLVILSENDITMAKQLITIKNQKMMIIVLSICFLILFILSLFLSSIR